MVADLQCSFALVGHVAVCAGYPGTSMYALVPHFKLRMLRLEHRCSCISMVPVFELLLVVKSKDVLNLQSLGPGIDQTLFGTAEMILVVALTADIGTHFLAGRVCVHVVVLNSLVRLESTNTFNEGGASNSQLHSLRIVTV